MTGTAEERAKRCPRCGEPMLPILYGYPSAETMDAAQRDEIALGGCVVGDDMPRWHCPEHGDEDPRS